MLLLALSRAGVDLGDDVGPFTHDAVMGEVISGSEAIATGVLTEHQLRRWYQPVFRDVYVPADTELSLRDRTVGAWLWSRRRAVVAGVAASALHGARWVDTGTPIELIAPNARPQPGLLVRNETLAEDEVTRVAGIPVATRARTAFDMGRHLPRRVAVARLDALMWASPFSVEDVMVLIKRYRGARGLRNLKAVLPLVDGGAASPRETAVRLTLIEAGLPSLTTQIPVSDGWGFIAALDMGWPEFKVAVEYDGDHHRTNRRQYVKDIARVRKLEEIGWIIIRVIAEDRPADVIARAHAALASRGYRPDRR